MEKNIRRGGGFQKLWSEMINRTNWKKEGERIMGEWRGRARKRERAGKTQRRKENRNREEKGDRRNCLTDRTAPSMKYAARHPPAPPFAGTHEAAGTNEPPR